MGISDWLNRYNTDPITDPNTLFRSTLLRWQCWIWDDAASILLLCFCWLSIIAKYSTLGQEISWLVYGWFGESFLFRLFTIHPLTRRRMVLVTLRHLPYELLLLSYSRSYISLWWQCYVSDYVLMGFSGIYDWGGLEQEECLNIIVDNCHSYMVALFPNGNGILKKDNAYVNWLELCWSDSKNIMLNSN